MATVKPPSPDDARSGGGESFRSAETDKAGGSGGSTKVHIDTCRAGHRTRQNVSDVIALPPPNFWASPNDIISAVSYSRHLSVWGVSFVKSASINTLF